MAYDEGLAERVRALVDDEPKITEKRMFGGLAFLVDDKMFVGVSKERLLVRVGKEHQAAALARPRVTPMVMGERTAQGFVYVDPVAIGRDAELERWVRPALAYARSLPKKKKVRR